MIKSVVESKAVSEYPKMMINDDRLIVLFANESCGVVVDIGKSPYTLGIHSNGWDINRFKPFHGSVTLTQE